MIHRHLITQIFSSFHNSTQFSLESKSSISTSFLTPHISPSPIKSSQSSFYSKLTSKPTKMATSSLFTQSINSASSLSFNRLGSKPSSFSARPINTRSRRSFAVKAELSPSIVISLSTGLSLFLGRFVFFNFQRENVAKQGLPTQNGKTHFDAGDSRAKEFAAVLKSNDPVGFNIVDVLAWGSIGHIVAYYILATSSNGYDPKFFG